MLSNTARSEGHVIWQNHEFGVPWKNRKRRKRRIILNELWDSISYSKIVFSPGLYEGQ